MMSKFPHYVLTLVMLLSAGLAHANSVTLKNDSGYAIGLKFRKAHHRVHQPVVLGPETRTTLSPHAAMPIALLAAKGQRVGLMVSAVQNPKTGEWVKLPPETQQFDSSLQGCWMPNKSTRH